MLLLVAVLTSACGSVAPSPPGSSGTRVGSPTASSSGPSQVVCPIAPPALRTDVAAAQDLGRNEPVMFGGLSNGVDIRETWLFDGHCWQMASPSISPPARRDAWLIYDPANHKSLLVGGRSDNTNGPTTVLDDAWTWDGLSWSQVASAPHFGDAVGAYDPVRNLVVILGNAPEGVGTWTWDGSNWNLLSGTFPQEVNPATTSMCFDGSKHSILLFGGWGTGVPMSNATWLWDGIGWTQQHPADSPSPRFRAALMCGDQPLLFGGEQAGPGTGPGDIWAWTGKDWTPLV